MRILLDECVPRPLARELAGHDVRTVPQMGWSGKKNGELLALMAQSGFEVLLTTDQSIRFEQNLASHPIAFVVMIGNRLADLLPLMPQVHAALATVLPGTIMEVGP